MALTAKQSLPRGFARPLYARVRCVRWAAQSRVAFSFVARNTSRAVEVGVSAALVACAGGALAVELDDDEVGGSVACAGGALVVELDDEVGGTVPCAGGALAVELDDEVGGTVVVVVLAL